MAPGSQTTSDVVFTLPNIRSFPEHVMKFIAKHDKEHVAFIDSETGRQYTYGQVHSMVRRLGSALRRRGLGQGHVVCLFSANSIDFGIILLAVTSIGCVVVTANPAYTVDELVYQLKDSGVHYIITDADVTDKAQAARRKCPTVKEIFVVDRNAGLESVYAGDDGSQFEFAWVNPDTAILVILYSSGTTGLPKGVPLTHNNNLSALLAARDYPGKELLPNKTSEVVMLCLPMFHAFCLSFMYLVLTRGDTIVVMRKFSPDHFFRTTQQYRVTVMPIVPPIAVMLAKSYDKQQGSLSSLQTIICGAAPLKHTVTEEVTRKTGVVIRQMYGMTETSAGIAYITASRWKKDSVGEILPHIEAKIIDPQTGITLPPGESGELCLRGYSITRGYLNNETATRQTIDNQGWFHTGDLACIDSDRFLFITGRLKELIKYNAYQVAPAELEALLLDHKDVMDAAVVGIPDELTGEVPKAFIVKRPGSAVTKQDIIRFVDSKVAPYKRLKGGVEFVQQIPKLPSGKILRRKLVELNNNNTAVAMATPLTTLVKSAKL